MSELQGLEPVATFCGNCDCGCPQLYVDTNAPVERRVVLTDDFGQQIRMSPDQFSSLLADAKSGKLDFGQQIRMSPDQFSSLLADAKSGKLDGVTTA